MNDLMSQEMEFTLRPITLEDNASIANVIRQVSAEYGLTADKGYSVADPTLDDLYSIYKQPRAAYWVVEHQGEVVGGGGFSPLSGAEDICELQKMYFLPICRGQGLAKQIIALCKALAKNMGYQQCYLESTANLKEALALYEKVGFRHLDAPLGNTGHDACEVVMITEL